MSRVACPLPPDEDSRRSQPRPRPEGLEAASPGPASPRRGSDASASTGPRSDTPAARAQSAHTDGKEAGTETQRPPEPDGDAKSRALGEAVHILITRANIWPGQLAAAGVVSEQHPGGTPYRPEPPGSASVLQRPHNTTRWNDCNRIHTYHVRCRQRQSSLAHHSLVLLTSPGLGGHSEDPPGPVKMLRQIGSTSSSYRLKREF